MAQYLSTQITKPPKLFADLALKMVEENENLATARDKDNMTALHLLAQTLEASANESSEGGLRSCKTLLLHFYACQTYKYIFF